MVKQKDVTKMGKNELLEFFDEYLKLDNIYNDLINNCNTLMQLRDDKLDEVERVESYLKNLMPRMVKEFISKDEYVNKKLEKENSKKHGIFGFLKKNNIRETLEKEYDEEYQKYLEDKKIKEKEYNDAFEEQKKLLSEKIGKLREELKELEERYENADKEAEDAYNPIYDLHDGTLYKDYDNPDVIILFKDFVERGRCDNIKECINLYEQEKKSNAFEEELLRVKEDWMSANNEIQERIEQMNEDSIKKQEEMFKMHEEKLKSVQDKMDNINNEIKEVKVETEISRIRHEESMVKYGTAKGRKADQKLRAYVEKNVKNG